MKFNEIDSEKGNSWKKMSDEEYPEKCPECGSKNFTRETRGEYTGGGFSDGAVSGVSESVAYAGESDGAGWDAVGGGWCGLYGVLP